jgi:hypothetical protein
MNNYDKILFSCKGNNEGNRFAELVTDGNFIIATNGKVLCKIPVKLTQITDKANPLNFESWDSVTKLEPNISKKISIYEVLDILEKCPKIEGKVSKHVQCKDCDGEGFVDYSYKSLSGLCFLEELFCPICKEKGYLIEETTTQETIIDEKALIKIGINFFYMGLFSKILEASVLLAEPLELVYQRKQAFYASKFKVGKIEFLIMPVYHEMEIQRGAFYEIEI